MIDKYEFTPRATDILPTILETLAPLLSSDLAINQILPSLNQVLLNPHNITSPITVSSDFSPLISKENSSKTRRLPYKTEALHQSILKLLTNLLNKDENTNDGSVVRLVVEMNVVEFIDVKQYTRQMRLLVLRFVESQFRASTLDTRYDQIIQNFTITYYF
jgi:hypothetical protein